MVKYVSGMCLCMGLVNLERALGGNKTKINLVYLLNKTF